MFYCSKCLHCDQYDLPVSWAHLKTLNLGIGPKFFFFVDFLNEGSHSLIHLVTQKSCSDDRRKASTKKIICTSMFNKVLIVDILGQLPSFDRWKCTHIPHTHKRLVVICSWYIDTECCQQSRVQTAHSHSTVASQAGWWSRKNDYLYYLKVDQISVY